MKDVFLMISVLVGSFFVGRLLISKVPPLLHTPLMSMTNAISAVTVLGAILLFATETDAVGKMFGAVAITMASFNMVGGFAVTNRMLKLFREKGQPDRSAKRGQGCNGAELPSNETNWVPGQGGRN